MGLIVYIRNLWLIHAAQAGGLTARLHARPRGDRARHALARRAPALQQRRPLRRRGAVLVLGPGRSTGATTRNRRSSPGSCALSTTIGSRRALLDPPAAAADPCLRPRSAWRWSRRRLFGDRVGGIAGFAFVSLPAVGAREPARLDRHADALLLRARRCSRTCIRRQRPSAGWALVLGAAVGTGLLAKYAMIYSRSRAALAAASCCRRPASAGGTPRSRRRVAWAHGRAEPRLERHQPVRHPAAHRRQRRLARARR